MKKRIEINRLIMKYEGQQIAGSFYRDLESRLKDGIDKVKGCKSIKELQVASNELSTDLSDWMKSQTGDEIRRAYQRGMGMVDRGIVFGVIDQNLVNQIVDGDMLWKAYRSIETSLSTELNDIIKTYFERPDAYKLDDLVNAMSQTIVAERHNLWKIARTEVRLAVNKGRERAFMEQDPEGNFRYKWKVWHDHRTSDVCKEIESIVSREGKGQGVSMERLKSILTYVAKKHLGEDWEVRGWVGHPHCRSVLERVV